MKTRTLCLVAGVALVAGASVAGASTPLPNATGTIHCQLKGGLKFTPPLHAYAAPDATPTLVTLSTTEFNCTPTGNALNIIGGSSKNSHTVNSNDCLTVLTSPFQPSSGLLSWKVPSLTQKWSASTVALNTGVQTGDGVTTPFVTDYTGAVSDNPAITTDGSYTGDTVAAHAQIKETLAAIQAKCVAGIADPTKGLKTLTINQTFSTFDLN